MNPGKSVTASAPAKVIITGEHFVVHGSYAVSAALSARARVTVSEESGSWKDSFIESGRSAERKVKIFGNSGWQSPARSVALSVFEELGNPKEMIKIHIESEIPPSSGLGSSAAISVATAAALTKYLGKDLNEERLCNLAGSGEKAVHGNPSGIDAETSLRGGIILFSKKSGVKPVPMNRGVQLLVVFSGAKRKTYDLVSKVHRMRARYPSFFTHLCDATTFTSLQVADSLSNGDLPYLGALMTLSQASLAWIGVSTRGLDRLIESVLEGESCFGAKLTGAGGGGSIIAVPKPDRSQAVLERTSEKYKHSFLVSIPQEGLRWETNK